MKDITIDNIRELFYKSKIKWTEHGSFRMFERQIHRADVEKAILNGNIIENYPDDYPYPSCLIYGITDNNKPLHIVCGIGEEYLYIITAYYPDDEKWEENKKRRK